MEQVDNRHSPLLVDKSCEVPGHSSSTTPGVLVSQVWEFSEAGNEIVMEASLHSQD